MAEDSKKIPDVCLVVRRSRDFGGAVGTLEVVLQAQGFHAPQDLNPVFMEFVRRADDLLHLYAQSEIVRATFSGEPIPNGGSSYRSSKVSAELRLPASQITVTMEKGKVRYRVLCGQWTEHGVPFYEEHMKQCGINPKNIPIEGYTFKQETFAIVQMEGDTPKRVVRLEKSEDAK